MNQKDWNMADSAHEARGSSNRDGALLAAHPLEASLPTHLNQMI
jgi:hypothetical protein